MGYRVVLVLKVTHLQMLIELRRRRRPSRGRDLGERRRQADAEFDVVIGALLAPVYARNRQIGSAFCVAAAARHRSRSGCRSNSSRCPGWQLGGMRWQPPSVQAISAVAPALADVRWAFSLRRTRSASGLAATALRRSEDDEWLPSSMCAMAA